MSQNHLSQGILTKQDIENKIDNGSLILHANKKQIQACSYDLRIGTIFRDGNKSNDSVTVEPGEIISLLTEEELKIPNNKCEEIVEEFEKVDSIHMKTMGFSPYRYEKTMLFTYNLILKRLNREPSDEIISQIKLCSRIIIEQMPKVIDGANELLEWAAKYFKLALLTRGEKNLQLKKLYSTGLVNYFDLIKVVSQKNTGIFRQFLEDTEYSPEDTWVIGDSIKSDINPGIEVGVSCILYVYNHHSYYWEQEYKCQSIGSFYKTHHLLEAKQILQSPLSFKQVNTLL